MRGQDTYAPLLTQRLNGVVTIDRARLVPTLKITVTHVDLGSEGFHDAPGVQYDGLRYTSHFELHDFADFTLTSENDGEDEDHSDDPEGADLGDGLGDGMGLGDGYSSLSLGSFGLVSPLGSSLGNYGGLSTGGLISGSLLTGGLIVTGLNIGSLSTGRLAQLGGLGQSHLGVSGGLGKSGGLGNNAGLGSTGGLGKSGGLGASGGLGKGTGLGSAGGLGASGGLGRTGGL